MNVHVPGQDKNVRPFAILQVAETMLIKFSLRRRYALLPMHNNTDN